MERDLMKNIFITLLICIGVVGCSKKEAGPTMFRGNPQSTGVFQSKPVRSNPEIVWETPFLTLSSYPIIDQGVIYSSCSYGAKLIAVKIGRFYPKRILWGTSSGFVLSKKKVFFFDPNGKLHALNKKSWKEEWNFGEINDENKFWFEPVIFNNTIYFGNENGFFFALDADTGEEKWKYATKGKGQTKAAIYKDKIFFGDDEFSYGLSLILNNKEYSSFINDSGNVYALNRISGAVLWRFTIKNQYVLSNPMILDNKLFFIGGDDLGLQDDKNKKRNFFLYALDIEKGKELWKIKIEGLSGLAGAQKKIFLEGKDKNVYAVNTKNGAKEWCFHTQTNLSSYISIANQTLYFGTEDNLLYAVDLESGKEQWHIKLERKVISSPVIYNGALFLSTRKEPEPQRDVYRFIMLK